MLKHVSHRSSSASLSRTCDLPILRSSTSATPSPLGARRGDFSFSEEDDSPKTFEGGYRDLRTPRGTPDNVSLISATSLSSLKLSCSRTSSISSLVDHAPVPVKIYLRRLRSDMEYKTVNLSLRTTCRELVALLLTKFRLRHRDPKLFFVLMEVTVRAPSDGAPVRRQLVLDDAARPAELQQCRPKGEANFSIGVRRGGLLRVHDAILNPGSQYKSLMVSLDTTANQLVQLLLDGCNSREDCKHYCLHQVRKSMQESTESDEPLRGDQSPLQIQASWPKDGSRMFVLRRNIAFTLSMKSRLSWRRSLAQSNSDTESESEDLDMTRASLTSSSSTLSSGSSSSSSGVSSSFSSSASSSASSSTSSSSGVFSEEGSPEGASPEAKPPPPPRLSSGLGRRPPRPVPRTLFPSKQKSASTTTLTNEEDVAPSPEAALRNGTLSSAREAVVGVHALSKSSLNLSLVSPLASARSLSFLSLFGGDRRTSTPKRPPTPVGGVKDPLSPAPPCSCRHCFYI